jgi:hypothetical protein
LNGLLAVLVLGAAAVIASGCATTRDAPPTRMAERAGFWLWILNVGEGHVDTPYPTLEACRRAKVRFLDNRAARCLPVSPHGPGPFYLYSYEHSWFHRRPDTPSFSSLDECDVAARPLKLKGVVTACAPTALEEPAD